MLRRACAFGYDWGLEAVLVERCFVVWTWNGFEMASPNQRVSQRVHAVVQLHYSSLRMMHSLDSLFA